MCQIYFDFFLFVYCRKKKTGLFALEQLFAQTKPTKKLVIMIIIMRVVMFCVIVRVI